MFLSTVRLVLFISMVCLGIVSYPSSPLAAILMNVDGSCADLVLRREGKISLLVGTEKTEKKIRLDDLVWAAGGEEKKFRVRGHKELLIGTIVGEIPAIIAGADTFLTHNSFVFLFNKDVKASEMNRLVVYEHDGTVDIIRSVDNKGGKYMTVSFLPEKWYNGATLSSPIYEKNLASDSNMKIKVTVKGNSGKQIQELSELQLCMNYTYAIDTEVGYNGIEAYASSKYSGIMKIMPFENKRTHFRNEYDMIGSYYFAAASVPINNIVHCSPTNNSHVVISKSRIEKNSLVQNIDVEYSHPFDDMMLGKMRGNGSLYLYMISPEKNLSVDYFCEGRLEVFKTASNVLKIPISIK